LKNLKISVLQLCSIDSFHQNWERIFDLFKKTESFSPDLICLPENAVYLRIIEGEPIPEMSLHDPALFFLQELCAKRKCTVHLGSAPVREGEKLYNGSLLISEQGIQISYKKIHLFDIHLQGQKPIKESDVFSHGDGPSTFALHGWKIGQSICYDLRFSELYQYYSKIPTDLILVPSAFLVPTGKAHWETLLRARAIESQAYVVAAAQAGKHLSSKSDQFRLTYGNSLIVSPWGEVVAQGSSSDCEILNFELSLDEIKKVRTQIPMHFHRRIQG
jgi:predicted amidohydrolase